MIKILTPEQARDIRYALYLDQRTPSMAALLMLQCGLRAYEATQARTEDLLPSVSKATELKVPAQNAKRALERIVPLPQELAQLIFYRLQDSTESLSTMEPNPRPLCKSERGGPITTRWLEMWMKEKSLQVLGYSITPYTLRHTFASRARLFCDLATLQKILGHKNLKSTQVYLHPTLGEMRNAIEATNAAN